MCGVVKQSCPLDSPLRGSLVANHLKLKRCSVWDKLMLYTCLCFLFARVAQLVERRAYTSVVLGSNPSTRT